MAENSEDLVSQITVTGGNEAAAEIQKFADKGGAAFDSLVKKAKAAGVSISGSSESVEKFKASLDEAGKSAEKAGSTFSTGFKANAKEVEQAAFNLGRSVKQLGKDFGEFAKKAAAVGAGVAAAGIAFAAASRNIAKQVDGTSDALDKQTNAQIDANNAALSAEQAEISHASTLRQLQGQLARGEISYTDYTKAVQAANRSFREQQRVAAETEAATRRVKEENDRLQKSLADKKALDALIDKFGGPLLTSLTAFGRQVEQVRKSFLSAFGPELGKAVDVIGQALGKNQGAIDQFFATLSKQFGDFITNNAPAIIEAFESIGKIAGDFAKGFVAALPAMTKAINGVIIPALRGFINFLDQIASAINKTFGTEVTAGFLVMAVAVGKLTGAFKLLGDTLRIAFNGFTLLRALVGGPLAIAIVGLVALLATLDWEAIGKRAVEVARSISQWWTDTKAKISAAWSGVVQFFSGIWNGITSAASAAAQFVTDSWNALTEFFSTLTTNIGTFFSNLWLGITNAVTTVVEGVKTAWNGLVEFFNGLVETVSGIFTSIWEGVKSTAGTAVDFIKEAWNGLLEFFNGFVEQLQSIWDAIKDGAVNGFNAVLTKAREIFNSVWQAAKEFLQPIIDLLNKIGQLSGSAGSAAAPQEASTFARGGSAVGHVRGPGTSTSDSIPAWLSNNEFVMRARAVRKYGLDFMRAVNSGKFKLPKLAFGGFISPQITRTAFPVGGSSGPSARLQPLNLTINNDTFEGLLMPEEVGSKLTKYAVAHQNRSAGRKPAWIGNRRN